MKTSLRITAAVAILAGAGLSGCAGDPFYGSNSSYSDGYLPAYQSSGYYEPRSGYYDSRNSQQPYYLGRPAGVYYR